MGLSVDKLTATESLAFTINSTVDLTDSELYNPLLIGGGEAATAGNTVTALSTGTLVTAETTTTMNLSETDVDADQRGYTG